MGEDNHDLVQRVNSFDPSYAQGRLDLLWSRQMPFGRERNPLHVYIKKIGEDRWILFGDFRRADNPFAFQDQPVGVNFEKSAVVVPTVAHSLCTDRCNQGEVADTYRHAIGTFFAFKEGSGIPQIERNFTLGGGAEDGAVLAHATSGHSLAGIVRRLQQGHPQSYFLHGVDIQTHVGLKTLPDRQRQYGVVTEYHGLGERPACGAIMGTLRSYDQKNHVHQRLRRDLGEDNYAYLTEQGVFTSEGIDITPVVAAAIVAVQGLKNTLSALPHELHSRALAHLTASVIVNETASAGRIIYLARATGFHGTSTYQGFDTDAKQYGGSIVDHHDGNLRLELSYNGWRQGAFPITQTHYDVSR